MAGGRPSPLLWVWGKCEMEVLMCLGVAHICLQSADTRLPWVLNEVAACFVRKVVLVAAADSDTAAISR